VTDEQLVRLARAGDADAFDQLVLRHQGPVYRAALAALRVPEEAEEVAQDAFVRAWRALPTFRAEASFRTWILTIAWRRALSRRRSVARWFRRQTSLDTDTLEYPSADRSDAGAMSLELRTQIVREIRALSPKLRDTLLLAQSGEYAYEDLAVMLSVPVGTVKWRVSEARRKLRARLAQIGYVDV